MWCAVRHTYLFYFIYLLKYTVKAGIIHTVSSAVLHDGYIDNVIALVRKLRSPACQITMGTHALFSRAAVSQRSICH